MSSKSKIVAFPGSRPVRAPLAWFCRLGSTGHKQLATFRASGGLPIGRVVVDASVWKWQKSLVVDLQRNGTEVVLDTKMAELGSPAKAVGTAAKAPWVAHTGGAPTGPDLFVPSHPLDVLGEIARFAVDAGVDTVLAPCHYLGDKRFPSWLGVDHEACLGLRRRLDAEGGHNIAIDYNLILPAAQLEDAGRRGEIVESLVDLPIDNVWMRVGSFGHDASPSVTRSTIEGFAAMHDVGRPIVADYAGGMSALAALAFGAASGIAHGIGERSRFDASGWERGAPPVTKGKRGGSSVRVAVAGLDKTLKLDEIRLLRSARGGSRLVSCADRDCCPRGFEDMLGEPRRHEVRRTLEALEELQAIPDAHRASHFVGQTLAKAARHARDVAGLDPKVDQADRFGVAHPERLMKSLMKHASTLDRKQRVLEDLLESTDTAGRAVPIVARRTEVERGSSVAGGRRR